ncbi:GAF domain-containing protein [Pedobacter sp. L105]|uniref:GAF domain-containing protein n=1 Tax=Pedobacter sp. L105 TaxID=1641871 RepID=UPI00131B3CB2|nr:GAF domain-containing protein [Pedobacter sp. L105]
MLHNELERLKAVNRFLALKISREEELNEIVRYAAEICNTPMAAIVLLDDDTQYILFSIGINIRETPRKNALCNYVIEQDEIFMIPDTESARHSLANSAYSELNTRFFAGAPLKTQEGYSLGGLCVIDSKPNHLSDIQLKMLAVLSRQVIHILNFDFSLALLQEQYFEAKKSEIKLRSFFESSVSCHLLVGKNLEVLAFNKTFSEIMRVNNNVEMRIGNSVTEYIDDLFMPEFLVCFKEALLGKHIKNESEMIRGDVKIWWNYDYVPAFDADGQIIGVSYNAVNISDLKLKETLSDAKDASLKAIAYIQSHEIRSPVSSILGLMNVFKTDDYRASKEEMMMMERAVMDLDEKIRKIVTHAASHK